MVKYSGSSLDAVFAALAHPTRRAMLEELARGHASPTKLAEPFEVSLPAISRHLRVLERAGLIESRKRGRTSHLFIIAGPLEAASIWLGEQKRFWEGRLDALERFLEQTSNPEAPWPHRPPAPRSRSASRAPTTTHAKTSSRRGRTRSG